MKLGQGHVRSRADDGARVEGEPESWTQSGQHKRVGIILQVRLKMSHIWSCSSAYDKKLILTGHAVPTKYSLS